MIPGAALEAIDTRFLREFIIVAQEGSIRKAAEQMGIVPSAISRKLTDAEIRLGVKLFERHSKGMELTEAGRLLLDHANHWNEEQEYVLDQISQYRDETRRIIRIGVGEGFAGDLMQNGMQPLMTNYPNLRFDFRMAGTDELLHMVSLGKVDIAIAYNPMMTPGTRSLAIGRQPLCAIVPSTSSLYGRESVQLAEVLDMRCAILNRQHGIRRLLDHVATERDLTLQPDVESDSISLLIRFVTAGLGPTFLPRFSATIQEARGELGIVPIEEPLLQDASTHLIVRARRRLPRSVNAVATLLSGRMDAFLG